MMGPSWSLCCFTDTLMPCCRAVHLPYTAPQASLDGVFSQNLMRLEEDLSDCSSSPIKSECTSSSNLYRQKICSPFCSPGCPESQGYIPGEEGPSCSLLLTDPSESAVGSGISAANLNWRQMASSSACRTCTVYNRILLHHLSFPGEYVQSL